MKTMLLASAAALSLGVASAYADGGGQATTRFTIIQAQQQPAAPAQAVPAQNAEVAHDYVTRSNKGTWLFPVNQNEGSN